MGYTFQQENQAWAESNSDPKETVDEAKSSGEGKDEGGESGHVADPTGQTGTLDTSGTTGTTETAEDISPVFDAADEANAENPAPEGAPFAAEIDPAATGDDALVPDYSDVKTDDQGRYVPDAADETLVNTQTTDTTGTAGTDGSAAAHEGSEKVGAEAAAEANGDAAGDAADDATGGFNLRKNPADFTVKEIVAWMATASDEQKEKVKAKEKDGDARKGILDF